MKFLEQLSPLYRSIVTAAMVLGGFAVVSTTLLALTNVATRDAIIESEKQALRNSLINILPAEQFNNELLDDRIQVRNSLLGTHLPNDIYRAKLDGENIAAIIATQAPNGYNGRINLLVGIYADGTIAGVRVTSHRETPGLGDYIDLAKSDWILGFNGRSITNPPKEKWQVKKDGGEFDQFTGATITPRAVVASVFNTLNFFHDNQDLVFSSNRTASDQ